jgi:hypothetical protein
MTPKTESLPRPEAREDRGAPAKDASPAEPPRRDPPEADQRFRDWALI